LDAVQKRPGAVSVGEVLDQMQQSHEDDGRDTGDDTEQDDQGPKARAVSGHDAAAGDVRLV